MTRRLFHLVGEDVWRTRPPGPWAPPSLASEGFVHLSWEDQVAGSLSLHFAGQGRVLQLEIDAAAVSDAMVEEPSRGGALFPHLRRSLRDADVLGVRVVRAI